MPVCYMAGIGRLNPFYDMVARSLPNINRSFFLIYDNTEGAMKPWLVWADGRADAIESVRILFKWTEGR